jgi:ribosomal protein L21
MARIRKVVALAAVLTLAITAVAVAAASKVTGGTTTLTASSTAAQLLSANHITVTPLAPATASGTTFTFPIKGGKVNTTTMHGVIRNAGGVLLSNGSKKFALRRPTIVSRKHGVSVFAYLRHRAVRVCAHARHHHAHIKCGWRVRWSAVRIARVTDVTVSNGQASGTVKITALTAHLINRLAGKKVASAGDVLGTATVSPTLQ